MNRLIINPNDPRAFGVADRIRQAVDDALKGKKATEFQIKQYSPRRSLNQNAYLWGVVYPMICGLSELEGWESEDVHEYMLGEWSGWQELKGFGRRRMKPIRRSSKLSKLDFADYVAFIQRKMAGLGLVIPDPNEYPEEENEQI